MDNHNGKFIHDNIWYTDAYIHTDNHMYTSPTHANSHSHLHTQIHTHLKYTHSLTLITINSRGIWVFFGKNNFVDIFTFYLHEKVIITISI